MKHQKSQKNEEYFFHFLNSLNHVWLIFHFIAWKRSLAWRIFGLFVFHGKFQITADIKKLFPFSNFHSVFSEQEIIFQKIQRYPFLFRRRKYENNWLDLTFVNRFRFFTWLVYMYMKIFTVFNVHGTHPFYLSDEIFIKYQCCLLFFPWNFDEIFCLHSMFKKNQLIEKWKKFESCRFRSTIQFNGIFRKILNQFMKKKSV